MALEVIKAPVGMPGKTGNAAKVKNTPRDVEIARRMLVANGSKVLETGRYDAKLGNAIKLAQGKAGIKDCDGVLMPADKTCKALLPKYRAEEALATNVEMLH